MYALVEDSTIIKTYNNPRGMTIGDVQYPQNIHGLWTESDLNAIGIYTVVEDSTNKRDEEWYINTNQTLDFAGGVVTATYGTATAKAIADTLWTQQDSDDGLMPDDKSVGDVRTKGLKTVKKEIFDRQAAGLLVKYDWYIIRNTEASTAIPSAITNYRTAVRTKCNSMQAQIDGAADVDALAALFTRTVTDGVSSRPLGEWPTDPNGE
jgi:hypothetical protein